MGEYPSTPKVLTDRLLRSWVRCRRKAWLDCYEDGTKRLWTAHRSLQLDQQQRNFSALLNEIPRKGLSALQEGQRAVVGLRIKSNDHIGNLLEVHPPLLLRVKGKCKWGKFSYTPVMSRQGHRITREHRLALSMAGKLLSTLQNSYVKYGLVIGRKGASIETEKVLLTKNLDNQLSKALSKINADLHKQTPPPITTDRKKCSLCSWRGLCNAEAAEKGYLSEVSGIGQRRSEILKELGIKDLEELAKSNPQDLRRKLISFGEQHCELAEKFIFQAKVQCANNPQRLKFSKVIPEISTAPGVLLYDIESDPDEKDDFLHGFLKLSKNDEGDFNIEKSRYHPLLLIQEPGKSNIYAWKRIKNLIFKYPNWPILHYGETEAISLLRTANTHGASQYEINQIRERLVDVHLRIKENWCLPISSYSLKSVATWIGFRWSKERVNGARALLWWRNWRGGGPKCRGNINSLKWIFQYNYEDTLATWAVALWLIKEDEKLN